MAGRVLLGLPALAAVAADVADVANVPCTGASAGLLPAVCEAWQALYDGTTGGSWTGCSTNRDDPCGCDGGALLRVSCGGASPTGQITYISMEKNGLKGPLPLSLVTLRQNGLTFLSLDGNELSGTIPAGLHGDQTNQLLGLSLANNKLTGLAPDMNFAAITSHCDIGGNGFCSPLPEGATGCDGGGAHPVTTTGACSATFTGSLDTYEYDQGTGCSTGKSAATVTTTQVITQLDDKTACVEQTSTKTGAKYWAKWACISDASGGSMTSTVCADAACATCAGDTATYLITFVSTGVIGGDPGACMDQVGDKPSYMMIPASGADATPYDAAMCPCMVPPRRPTPPPTPPTPPPTPDPAEETCDNCTAKGQEWCWDSQTCIVLAGLCSFKGAVCTDSGICQCASCTDTSCGAPAPPTPAPPTPPPTPPVPTPPFDYSCNQFDTGCNSCADGTSGKCKAPGSTWPGVCSKVSAMTGKCIGDGHDCCESAPTPPPTPYEATCADCLDADLEWCYTDKAGAGDCRAKSAGCDGGKQAAACSDAAYCGCTSCTDTTCSASTPTPAPGAAWTGSQPTFTYTTMTSCGDGKSAAAVSDTVQINRMADGLSSCAKQTFTAGGSSYNKWSCDSTAPGGRLTSVHCADPGCMACDDDTKQGFWISYLAGQGACLDQGATGTLAYMLDEPSDPTSHTAYNAAVAPCIVAPAPTPPPPGPTWSGSAFTYSYDKAGDCSTGRSSTPVGTSTSLTRMADGLSSCATQDLGGTPNYNKWTCATAAQGGTIKSEQCTDATCSDCQSNGNTFAVSFAKTGNLGGGLGACCSPDGSSTAALAYMLWPPSDFSEDAKFEAAIAPCMVPPAPVPTPPPPVPTPPAPVPTPPPVATCAACNALANMEWCWDSPRCLTPGTGCSEPRATCNNPIDCACSDCDSSQKCGAPWSGNLNTYSYTAGTKCSAGKSPTTTTTTLVIKKMDDNRSACVQQMYTQTKQLSWRKWQCSDATGGTMTSTVCSDDACTDCTGSATTYEVEVLGGYQGACVTDIVNDVSYMTTPPNDDPKYEAAICPCMADGTAPPPTPPPPTPAPATTCDACVQQDNRQWCWKASPAPGCFTPGDATSGCTEATATCTNPVDCQCSDCSNSAACGGPAPPTPPPTPPTPPPTPPTPSPPVPTPPPTPPSASCDECLGKKMEWCWSTGQCIAVGAGCTFYKAACADAAKCQCSSCTDTKCGAPEFYKCQNDQCVISATGISLGDCVIMCNPPPPTPAPSPANQWTGVAEFFEYAPNTNCNEEHRTPATPVGLVSQITLISPDPEHGAQCNWEYDLDATAAAAAAAVDTVGDTVYKYYKYECDDGNVVKTICDDKDCGQCTGVQTIYSVTYNDRGACLGGGGFGAKNGFEIELPQSTLSGTFATSLANCMLPPPVSPTPGPTPVPKADDAVPIGVGLGVAIPAVAGGLWFARKRRAENTMMPSQQPGGTALLDQQQMTSAGSLGEMYSSL